MQAPTSLESPSGGLGAYLKGTASPVAGTQQGSKAKTLKTFLMLPTLWGFAWFCFLNLIFEVQCCKGFACKGLALCHYMPLYLLVNAEVSKLGLGFLELDVVSGHGIVGVWYEYAGTKVDHVAASCNLYQQIPVARSRTIIEKLFSKETAW